MLANKLIAKIVDPSKAEEYYNSYLKRKKIQKMVKGSEIVTYQRNTTEKPNVVCIKLVTIEHPKTSRKLFKPIKQAEKVSQVGFGRTSNSPLYRKTKKSKNILHEKNAKITKPAHLKSWNFEFFLSSTAT